MNPGPPVWHIGQEHAFLAADVVGFVGRAPDKIDRGRRRTDVPYRRIVASLMERYRV
jgi:hypothetical protein